MEKFSVGIQKDAEFLAHANNFSNELSDTFYSNDKKGSVFCVSLNSNGLLLKRNTTNVGHKNHLVNICDIIGGRCVWIQKSASFGAISTCGACTPNITEKKNRKEETENAYLYIFAYVIKNSHRRSSRRERTVITLRFRTYDNHEDNMREAEKWHMALKFHRNNHILQCNIQRPTISEKDHKSLENKRLLILLNPKSGSGRAREIFNHHVVTILNEAETAYDLHATKHPKYAMNYVLQKNLSNWSGIVAVGGDGLFHEILNGLLKRKDWKKIVNDLTLGIVPCGSGNGLARSIAHYYQEPYEPKPILGAALSLVSGKSALMDIVQIEQFNKITYSFLSVGWGLISDIDIESERLRSLGYQRFSIWTLHRLINLRTYRGKISFLPKSNCEQENYSELKNENNLQHSISFSEFPPSSELKNQAISSVCEAEFEDVISLETVANQPYHSRCNSLLSTASKLSTYYSIAESIYHSVAGNSDCFEGEVLDMESPDKSHSSRLSQLDKNTLPSLSDPVPNSWSVENGEFVMIHAAYQTHLGSDCLFSPHSKLNDGIIYLVMIRGGISRSQLFSFLINMSSGTHLPKQNNDFIRVERVVAFRLEPYQNSGILTVDGERIESDILQARIFPSSVNIMVPNNLSLRDS